MNFGVVEFFLSLFYVLRGDVETERFTGEFLGS